MSKELIAFNETDLVVVKGGKVVCNSLMVADRFGKDHFNILRDIQNIECSQAFRAINFEGSSYKSKQGKEMPMYEMTRDGFTFLAMGFTGKQAAEWKEKYINAFNTMEKTLIGGYAIVKEDPTEKACVMNSAASVFKSFLEIGQLIGCDINIAAISANQAVNKNFGVNLLSDMGQTHLTALKQEIFFTPTELGSRNNISARAFNELLGSIGMQRKENKKWIPTEQGLEFCKILDTGKKRGSGAPITQVKWSEKVLPLLPSMN